MHIAYFSGPVKTAHVFMPCDILSGIPLCRQAYHECIGHLAGSPERCCLCFLLDLCGAASLQAAQGIGYK